MTEVDDGSSAIETGTESRNASRDLNREWDLSGPDTAYSNVALQQISRHRWLARAIVSGSGKNVIDVHSTCGARRSTCGLGQKHTFPVEFRRAALLERSALARRSLQYGNVVDWDSVTAERLGRQGRRRSMFRRGYLLPPQSRPDSTFRRRLSCERSTDGAIRTLRYVRTYVSTRPLRWTVVPSRRRPLGASDWPVLQNGAVDHSVQGSPESRPAPDPEAPLARASSNLVPVVPRRWRRLLRSNQ